jgi:uncharacterized protein with PIN domain
MACRQPRTRIAVPALYCTVHGRGHENRVIVNQDEYRQAAESVLIVHGKLRTGPYRCDKCNAELKRGDTAMLMSALPRFDTESMYEYDFAYEQRYFDLAQVSMTLYGARWRKDPSAMLRKVAHG